MHPPTHIPVGIGCGFLSLARQPGIGEEHVDRAIFVLGSGDQRLDVFLEPDIGGDGEPVDIAGDAGEPVARGLEIGDHDAARASLRIGPRHCLADPARAAGDDTDLVLDVHGSMPLLVIVRSGLSALIQALVTRLLDREGGHQVEHRGRNICCAGKGRGRAHQHVDLHGAAELVVLQDRRLVVGRGSRTGDALDPGDIARRHRIGL
ncbi:hypothetical protein chiPu_0031780, partial [Chiloscyllium punctatum]|nr:hypothetical protein [Chiloscyllium punctatum]